MHFGQDEVFAERTPRADGMQARQAGTSRRSNGRTDRKRRRPCRGFVQGTSRGHPTLLSILPIDSITSPCILDLGTLLAEHWFRKKNCARLTDSQSIKDPIRSVHTMVSTTYRVDAFSLCPKTCHGFSYTLVCRADPFARFRAVRTISSSGCWYCTAVLTSLWPIVFITAARFPVLFSTRVQ